MAPRGSASRLLVLNVPGLDLRRIDAASMPFVHRLLQDHPRIRLRSMPTTELFPTLVTGVWPREHRIWNVSLRSDRSPMRRRWYDRLPDWLTTTAQGSVDLRARLRRTGVPEDEYDYFLAVAVGRFWFHTARAREAITRMLGDTPDVSVLTPEELKRYDVDLDGDRFGQLYAVTDHGRIFFPHDFHQPLGNLFMGLKDPIMRPRILDPRHRGYHGHLPAHPAEPGFVLLADRRFVAHVDEAALIDLAPNLLAALGESVPGHMRGRVVCSLGNGPGARGRGADVSRPGG